MLTGQRIDGIGHVFDAPAAGDHPTFLVETHLERSSELTALIDDDLTKATRLGYSPMSLQAAPGRHERAPAELRSLWFRCCDRAARTGLAPGACSGVRRNSCGHPARVRAR
jgi:hypothetical protein